MFILMSKVSMRDAGNALVRIGVSGPKADEQLNNVISNLPKKVDDMTQANGYTVIKCAGSLPRYEIYGELEPVKTLWGQLDVNAAPVGAGCWETLDITAGIPTIYPQTTEAFVPQMTNMQVINGVSFQKGCYTGQEIVARMQYLGKLKRRMFRIHIETSKVVNAGDKLFSKDSTSGQGPGQIVNAQMDSDGGYTALAVINISDTESDNLQLYDENGPKVTIQTLPYSIEDNEK